MMSSLCAAIKMLLGFVGRWDIKHRPLAPIRLPSFLSSFIFPHLFVVHSVDAEQLLVIKGTPEPRTMLNQKKKKAWRDNQDKDDTFRLEWQSKLMLAMLPISHLKIPNFNENAHNNVKTMLWKEKKGKESRRKGN